MITKHLWSYNIALLIFTFGIFACALYNIAMRPWLPSWYGYVMQSWNTNPIVSVYQVTNTAACPNGDENFFNFYWAGTIEGCYCPPNELEGKVDGFLFPSECTTDQFEEGCGRILETNGEQMSFVNDEGRITRLCATRLQNFNFALNRSEFGLESCPNNTIRCGGNDGYCINSEETVCPINDIVAGTMRPDYNHQIEIRIGTSMYLYISRTSNSMPTTDLRMTEGLGVCMENNESNITPNRTDYILYKAPRTRCLDLDPRFVELVSLGEASYFEANQMLTTISNLPGYQTNNTYIYGSYVRSQIPWAKRCFDGLLDDMFDLSTYFKGLRALRFFEIVITALFSIYTAYCSKTELELLQKEEDYDNEDSETAYDLLEKLIKDRKIKKIVSFVIISLEVIISFAAQLYVLVRIYNLAEAQCADQITNAQMADFAENFVVHTAIPYLVSFFLLLFILVNELLAYRKSQALSNSVYPNSEEEAKEKAKDDDNDAINIVELGALTAHGDMPESLMELDIKDRKYRPTSGGSNGNGEKSPITGMERPSSGERRLRIKVRDEKEGSNNNEGEGDVERVEEEELEEAELNGKQIHVESPHGTHSSIKENLSEHSNKNLTQPVRGNGIRVEKMASNELSRLNSNENMLLNQTHSRANSGEPTYTLNGVGIEETTKIIPEENHTQNDLVELDKEESEKAVTDQDNNIGSAVFPYNAAPTSSNGLVIKEKAIEEEEEAPLPIPADEGNIVMMNIDKEEEEQDQEIAVAAANGATKSLRRRKKKK